MSDVPPDRGRDSELIRHLKSIAEGISHRYGINFKDAKRAGDGQMPPGWPMDWRCAYRSSKGKRIFDARPNLLYCFLQKLAILRSLKPE